MGMDPTLEQLSTTKMDHSTASPRLWAGLALAAAIVLAAVLVTRSGQGGSGGGLGIVAQVEPSDAELADLETAPQVGALAPNFRLQTFDGEEMLLSDLRGRPVFINFWATWCFFCISEMPAIQKLADDYGDRVVMLGVNVAEPVEDAQTFARNFEITYPLVLDSDREVTETYQVRSMPTSVFVDADGVIQSFGFGAMFPNRIREQLDLLLPSSIALAPPSTAGHHRRQE